VNPASVVDLFDLGEWLGVIRDEHTRELVHYTNEEKDASYVLLWEQNHLKVIANQFKPDGNWLYAVWTVEARRFVKDHGDNGTFPRAHRSAVRQIAVEMIARDQERVNRT
jgi:hypothetical protein